MRERYSIPEGPPFAVDAATGEISVAGTLDYESGDTLYGLAGSADIEWQTSPATGTPSWTEIEGADTVRYTPIAGDEGELLRAVFEYDDGHGTGKRAESVALTVVGATPPVVSFAAASYAVAAGDSVDVGVTVSSAPTNAWASGLYVEVAITLNDETSYDTLDFQAGDSLKTIAVGADSLTAGDTVVVELGTLPAGAVAGYDLESALKLGIEGVRNESPTGPARQGLSLRLGIVF